MKITLPATALLCSSVGLLHGQIAFTGFEEPSEIASGFYTDTGDSGSDHTLANNLGESIVNYSSVGGEMGFASSYISTGGTGLTDGDSFGVTDTLSGIGSYPEGVQGFRMSDTDGIGVLTFDTLDISSEAAGVLVSFDYFLTSTSWESSDFLSAGVNVDGTFTSIFDTSTASGGPDIDNLGIEGSWQSLTSTAFAGNGLTLSILFESNAGVETVFIDNVGVFAAAIPEPSTYVLIFGVLALGVVYKKRRSKHNSTNTIELIES